MPADHNVLKDINYHILIMVNRKYILLIKKRDSVYQKLITQKIRKKEMEKKDTQSFQSIGVFVGVFAVFNAFSIETFT